MTAVSFLLALFSIFLAGGAVVYFLARCTGYKFMPHEFFPFSFLAGSAAVSILLFLYYLLGVSFTFKNILIVPAALLLAAFLVLKCGRSCARESFISAGSLRDVTVAERLLLAGIFFQILWVFFLVAPTSVHSHDAVANYALKAKIFFMERGIPQGFFNWPETVVAHPDYPPLLPLLMTWVYEFTGFNDVVIPLIMPVFYTAFLGMFYFLLKKVFGRAYSLLFTFLLATIPQLADYATVIHADLVFTAFVTCAFIYFIVYVKSRERSYLVFSSLCFAFSLWVKNEAIVFVAGFAAVLILDAAATKKQGKAFRWSDLLIPVFLISLVAFPWFYVKIKAGMVNSDIDFSVMTPARFWENVKDIPVLLNLFQQEVFGPKKWNIFWVAFFAALVWKRKKLVEGENLYMSAFLLVALSGYLAGYLSTTGGDLFFYVNTTISRFMLHFSGLAMFFTALLLWDDIRQSPVITAACRMEKYVFLDRDGVINKDGYGWTKEGYITKWEDFHFLDGALSGISKLSDEGYKCVIISNQQCVGKRFMTKRELLNMTDKMRNVIASVGGNMAGAFYCTHRKEENCLCRKPKPGLFYRAKYQLGIMCLAGKYFIGDTEKDVKAAKEAGLKSILVLTGRTVYAQETMGWEHKPDHVCNNLKEAADLITRTAA